MTNVSLPGSRDNARFDLVVALLLAFLIAGTSAVLASSFGPPFESPDEGSQWLAASRFADSGSVWQDDALTRSDSLDMLHYRFEVSFDGRVTTKYPILDPVLSGALMFVLGEEGAVYGLALVSALGVIAIALGMRTLGGSPLMALWLVPTIWTSAHVFAGTTWFLFFMGLAFATYAMSLRERSVGWWSAAALFAGVGLLTRYQDAPVILLFAVALGWQLSRGDPARPVSLRATYAVLGVSFLVAFVIPQLTINWLMFNDPLLFGELLHAEGLPTNGSLRQELLRAVLPWTPSLEVIGRSLFYLVVLLVPGSVAAAGLYIWLRTRGVVAGPTRATAVLLSVAIAYSLVARANPDGFLSTPDRPLFNSIIVRYWYPLYLSLTVAGAVAVSAWAIPPRLRSLVLVSGALIGMAAIWVLPQGGGLLHRRQTVIEDAKIREAIAMTEVDAVVYAGALDKWSIGLRSGGTWRQSVDSEENFPAQDVADSALAVHSSGRQVYFLLGADPASARRDALTGAFAERGFALNEFGEPGRVGILLRLTRSD
jgi:hypothetical protein